MSPLFHEISLQQNLVEKNKNLFQLFAAAFEVTAHSQQISQLQKEFMIVELCFSYSHLGYSLFAVSSIALAKEGLIQQCGVDGQFIEKYMFHLKEYLRDEIHFSQKDNYFTEESLEFSFAREFIKRIFCTDREDDIHTGLFIYDKNYLDAVRMLSRKKISELNTVNSQGVEYQREQEILYFEKIYSEFVLFLHHLKSDPLTLIVSRFESFINFFKNDSHSIFIFKENNNFLDEKSKKMTALLTLLVPHRHVNGELLLKESLLTPAQMSKLFSPKFSSHLFNLQPIRSWLGVDNELEINSKIEFLIEEALKCGVVFKVPHGKHSFAYGLSGSGMKILQPFQQILTDSLIV